MQSYFNNDIAIRFFTSIGEKTASLQGKIAIIALTIITAFSIGYLLYKRYRFKAEAGDSIQTKREIQKDPPVTPPTRGNEVEEPATSHEEVSSHPHLDSPNTPLNLIREYQDGFKNFYELIKRDEEGGSPSLLRRMKNCLEEHNYSSDLDFEKLGIYCRQFEGLLAKLEELKFQPLQIDDQGYIPIPNDGNCFYHSIVAGFKAFNCPQIFWETHHEDLRSEVIALEEQLLLTNEDYKYAIQGSILQYLGDMDRYIADDEFTCSYIKNELNQDDTNLRARINEIKKHLEPLRVLDENNTPSEDAINRYLNLARSKGFWAGPSEIFAAAEFLKNNDIGLTIIASDYHNNFHPELQQRITICYDGHHYDLRVANN